MNADPLKSERKTSARLNRVRKVPANKDDVETNGFSVLTPGKNCWRIEHADRVAFLVDGAEYFHAFRETAKNARHSILLISWDIDSRFRLERDHKKDCFPVGLSDFLNTLVERKKDLHVYILDWDFTILYAPDREWLPLYQLGWTTHRRICFRLDSRHPVGASHHQKIVVVDDQVAFVGGLDFTFGRWDTSEHRPDDPRRCDRQNEVPQPYHDIQMMVSGRIARVLGDLARERWQTATGQTLSPPDFPDGSNPWPEEIAADLVDVPVGVARTYPKYNDQQEVREVERLLVDLIFAARKTVYIENQYLTAVKIGDALARRLEEDDGPEIILIMPQQSVGWLSQGTMDVLRERLLKRLYSVDRHDRFRVYYPEMPGLGNDCINVHSKLVIIDDEWVRVGSANLNNRSMGLDTECDLVIEARGDARIRTVIGALRNRLLAEHLGVARSVIEECLAREQSVIRVIESNRGTGRTLRILPFRTTEEDAILVPDLQIADPEQPIDAEFLAERLVGDEDRSPIKRSLVILASVLVLALSLAAGWHWTPLGEWVDIAEIFHRASRLRGSWLAPVIVSAVYILGGLIVFPVTLIIIATGVAFGAFYGFIYAVLGAELSACVTYAIGYFLGHGMIRRLSRRWTARVSRRLARQDLLAIFTLRIIPAAPFTVINLIAGASHINFGSYALGTLLGIMPGTLVFTLFSDRVYAAIQAPETTRFVVLLAIAAAIVAGTRVLIRWLLKRQDTGNKEKP